MIWFLLISCEQSALACSAINARRPERTAGFCSSIRKRISHEKKLLTLFVMLKREGKNVSLVATPANKAVGLTKS